MPSHRAQVFSLATSGAQPRHQAASRLCRTRAMVTAPLTELGWGRGGGRRGKGEAEGRGRLSLPPENPGRPALTPSASSRRPRGAAGPTWPVCSPHPRGLHPPPGLGSPPRRPARPAPASERRRTGTGPGGGGSQQRAAALRGRGRSASRRVTHILAAAAAGEDRRTGAAGQET